MRILIISSLSPFKSGNYGNRLIDAFSQAGHQIDYLTKYRFEGMADNMYSVYDEFEPALQKITANTRSSYKNYLCFRYPLLDYLDMKRGVKQSVIPLREDEPEVDADQVCAKVIKQYDVVYITFWQYMLSTKTIKMLYEKLHVPIILNTVDMYPMTGGCYYFADCKNYKSECKKCPASKLFEHPNTPHFNFMYKKEVYNSINCIYLCNEWMKERILQSKIIPEYRLRPYLNSGNSSFLLNESREKLRSELRLPKDKFILFAGAANVRIRRKGFNEMARSVNRFVKRNKNATEVIVVLAGKNDEDFQRYFKPKVVHVGFLSTENLAKMYRASDVYLSPSIDDAGPSMVIQSLISGTPVVAFNIGIAPEVISNGETGYIAPLRNIDEFAKGIEYFYNMPKEKKAVISHMCRKSMVEGRNPQSFIKGFERLYNEFKDHSV